MDLAMLQAAVRSSGCLATAVEDMVQRVERELGTQEATPEAVKGAILRQKAQAPHCYPPDVPFWEQLGIAQEVFEALPPADRKGLYDQHHPHPPVQRRLRPSEIPYMPSAAEQAELDSIPNIHERATRFRALRDAYGAAHG